MASMISLSAALSPSVEPASALPSDAQVPVDGLAELIFMPLDPQPLPLVQGDEGAPPVEPAPLPHEPVLDPQQWLSAMLNQQAVQVQARGYTEAQPPASALMPGVDRLLSRLPMQVGTRGLGQEGLNSAAYQLPMDKAMQQVSERLAPVAQSTFSGPLGTLEKTVPASPAVAPVLSSSSAALGVSTSDGLPLAAPAPLPGSEASHQLVLERDLKLATPQARWGEQMLHALRETVQVQVQQRFQQATIRLDPPELGSLEIFITHESGRLSVHISAAQGDVARLLQHTSDRLRQELVEQNTLQVNVQISSDSQGHAGRDPSRQRHEHEIAEALEDAHGGATPSKKHRSSDVLVTV